MFRYRFPLFLLALMLALLAGCKSVAKPKSPQSAAAQPTPAPTPTPTPSPTPTLRDFLRQQLGSKFHSRQEWAGAGPEFAPRPFSYRIWAPIGKVYAVTIHHAEFTPHGATPEIIRSIYQAHTRIGGRLDAADVGYHFLVDASGQVWEGRDAEKIGTHVGSHPPGHNNPGNLGICGLGDFRYREPPQAMSDQIVNLTLLLAKYYGRPLLVRGHRDWSGINGVIEGDTTCPGRLESAVSKASVLISAAFSKDAPAGRDVAALNVK